MAPHRANPFRTLAATSVLESFLIFGSISGLIPGSARRRTTRLRMNRKLAQWLADSIGLSMTVEPVDVRPKGTWGRLILANHLSVLDVIALASLEEGVFVTSREMEETPIIGHLARIGGCVFVERRSREHRTNELDELAAILEEGRTLILFPEGTNGDGSQVLRFRNGLIQAAMKLERVEILPVCLQYETYGEAPITKENRDRVFLPHAMSVGKHLWNLFTNPNVRLKIQYLEPFFAHECETASEIAARAESAVRKVFRPLWSGE